MVKIGGENELSGLALELLSDLHQQVAELDETQGQGQLLGITKRGNTYLLIHGARTVSRHASGKTDRLSRRAPAIQARRGANVAAVALARDRRYRADWAEQV